MQSTVHRNLNSYMSANSTIATEEEVQTYCGPCDRYKNGTCEMGMDQQVLIDQDLVALTLHALLLDPQADQNVFSEMLQTKNGASNQQHYAKRNYCKFRTVNEVEQASIEQPSVFSV